VLLLVFLCYVLPLFPFTSLSLSCIKSFPPTHTLCVYKPHAPLALPPLRTITTIPISTASKSNSSPRPDSSFSDRILHLSKYMVFDSLRAVHKCNFKHFCRCYKQPTFGFWCFSQFLQGRYIQSCYGTLPHPLELCRHYLLHIPGDST